VAANSTPKVTHNYPHVTADMTIDELGADPAFKPFNNYVVPVEDPTLIKGIHMLTIKQFLPAAGWHDPDTIAGGLNFIIDMVNAGDTPWHQLYSDADIAADPTKQAAGFWFIPGERNKPLAVVVPGGGFRAVETLQEGFPYAKVLHDKGYNVAILKYRVQPLVGQGNSGQSKMSPAEANAEADMAALMKVLNDNAAAWKINLDNYSVWGSSAGGMVASQWAMSGPNSAKANNLSEPAIVVNAYTPPQEFTPSASLPPFFITDAANDDKVSPALVAKFAAAQKAAGGVVEFERFPSGGHGFGVGDNTAAAGWFDKATAFWRAHMSS
jgi:acetyl esterase/lipase